MSDVKPWLRIGYVSPHPLVDTLPYEFYFMAPPGVMMMAACLEIGDYTTEAVEDQLGVLDKRIDSLMKRGAERIVISGVPIALALGPDRMRRLLADITARFGVPADTDLEAIIAGAKHLGAKSVGTATRWKPAMNERLAAYLGAVGMEVVGTASSGRTMAENAALDDTTGMQLAIDLGASALGGDDPPDALIMPGGRWITIEAVRTLEARFGKPVLTNYAAGLWAALRPVWKKPIPGFGRLMTTLGGGG